MDGHRKISGEYLFENIGKPSFTKNKNKELMTLTINFSLNCDRKAESKSSDEGTIGKGKFWLKEKFGGIKNE